MTTVYDVLKSLAKYNGNPNAHDMVIAVCRKYAGKTVSMRFEAVKKDGKVHKLIQKFLESKYDEVEEK